MYVASAVASAAAGGCSRGGWRIGLRREHGGDHIALPLDGLHRLLYGKQALDLDHATGQIDVHLDVGVNGLNGLGDRPDTVTTGHTFNNEIHGQPSKSIGGLPTA